MNYFINPKMKKILLLFCVFITSLFIGSVGVNALTTELVSETDTTKVYDILATAPVDSSAMVVRLSVTGGIVTNVESINEDSLRFLPTCENGRSFDEKNICVDIAVINGIFTINQPLLRVTVTTDNSGEDIVFIPDSSHAYLSINGELINETGEVTQTFPTRVEPEEPAPSIEDAKTNDTNYLPFVLLLGILVVLVGAFLAVVLFSDKGSAKE